MQMPGIEARIICIPTMWSIAELQPFPICFLIGTAAKETAPLCGGTAHDAEKTLSSSIHIFSLRLAKARLGLDYATLCKPVEGKL